MKSTQPSDIFLYVLVAFCVIACKRNAKPETFIIPEGRVGNFIIYYNQKNGKATDYKDGRRVYHLPVSGALYTQFKSNDGWLDQTFYYRNSSGQLRPILIDSSKYYYNDSAMAQRFKHIHAKDTLVLMSGLRGKIGSMEYTEFTIGTYQNTASFDTISIQKQ